MPKYILKSERPRPVEAFQVTEDRTQWPGWAQDRLNRNPAVSGAIYEASAMLLIRVAPGLSHRIRIGDWLFRDGTVINDTDFRDLYARTLSDMLEDAWQMGRDGKPLDAAEIKAKL